MLIPGSRRKGEGPLGRWADVTVSFEGLDPARTTGTDTCWQFTARAGGRAYSVYLKVRNKILDRFGLPRAEPPPPGLVPPLRAYVAEGLRRPEVELRAPRSLEGYELTLIYKEEWEQMRTGRP